MKSRDVNLRLNPAGLPENKKITYPGKGTCFCKHLFITYPAVFRKMLKSNIHCDSGLS